ncbi:aconitase/3-isopropylmalate dehydratase large subunit family protein [Cellulomonas sp. Leaf334]|uniref:3-isopropylmalate dehydratase large subunit n=1 Tax=Cellulomonas sp. Leaf334 TaxID=1736339 RepID=UPI0006F54EFD|nr:aconitase/3-isopropylmalate dehydratase large subunit family protein [Cellulomonas sp. Leaf334]KQR11677.1 3-isopropylmalate dehydratase large subunit [Cellulomonas sp. Leaf334]
MAPRPTPLVNRIVAERAGRATVDVGELLFVDVDRVYVQDGNSPTIARLYRQHGLSTVFDPERVAFVFDHTVLVPNREMADRIGEAERFARELGVQVFGRGAGISHLVALEEGWYVPGNVVLGSDSHTCVGGALQSLALGMGATDIAAAMVTGRTWLKVPDTVWLHVSGTPHASVRPKDVLLEVLRRFGMDAFLYRSVQWTGPWVESLSEDSAASVASMGVEMGAKCVFLPPRPGSPEGLVPTAAGPGDRVLELDVSTLSPMVSLPHSPHGSVPVDELGGRPVDYVFVGTCTNGRLEDIAEIAGLVEGHRVAPSVHFVVTPGSRQTYLDAISAGYVATLVEAGAIVTPPGCGACVGTQGSVPASGSTVLTTMNRNFKGRMGNPDAGIHLSSPLVAATAALLGRFPTREDLPG